MLLGDVCILLFSFELWVNKSEEWESLTFAWQTVNVKENPGFKPVEFHQKKIDLVLHSACEKVFARCIYKKILFLTDHFDNKLLIIF